MNQYSQVIAIDMIVLVGQEGRIIIRSIKFYDSIKIPVACYLMGDSQMTQLRHDAQVMFVWE